MSWQNASLKTLYSYLQELIYEVNEGLGEMDVTPDSLFHSKYLGLYGIVILEKHQRGEIYFNFFNFSYVINTKIKMN